MRFSALFDFGPHDVAVVAGRRRRTSPWRPRGRCAPDRRRGTRWTIGVEFLVATRQVAQQLWDRCAMSGADEAFLDVEEFLFQHLRVGRACRQSPRAGQLSGTVIDPRRLTQGRGETVRVARWRRLRAPRGRVRRRARAGRGHRRRTERGRGRRRPNTPRRPPSPTAGAMATSRADRRAAAAAGTGVSAGSTDELGVRHHDGTQPTFAGDRTSSAPPGMSRACVRPAPGASDCSARRVASRVRPSCGPPGRACRRPPTSSPSDEPADLQARALRSSSTPVLARRLGPVGHRITSFCEPFVRRYRGR